MQSYHIAVTILQGALTEVMADEYTWPLYARRMINVSPAEANLKMSVQQLCKRTAQTDF
jgi:hypothetical protein